MNTITLSDGQVLNIEAIVLLTPGPNGGEAELCNGHTLAVSYREYLAIRRRMVREAGVPRAAQCQDITTHCQAIEALGIRVERKA